MTKRLAWLLVTIGATAVIAGVALLSVPVAIILAGATLAFAGIFALGGAP